MFKPKDYYSPEKKIETIEENKADLAEHIRDFTRDQYDLWLRVPDYSLKAFGRIDQDDRQLMACAYGIWPVFSLIDTNQFRGAYNAGVDLATGEIIHPRDPNYELDPMAIINLNIEELNAKTVIDGLKKVYRTARDDDICGSRGELASLHKKMRQRFNIQPYYSRDERNPLQAIVRTAIDDFHFDVQELQSPTSAGDELIA